MDRPNFPLSEAETADTVRRALAEDIGSGDLTAALIPEERQAVATVLSREAAVLCGTPWFEAVFRQLDSRVRIEWQAREGDLLVPHQPFCTLDGPASVLVTGERTALNFLQTLSGTATLARRYADTVKGSGAEVLDTRKTIPGLRNAQKYAVAVGGCRNHRRGLYDGILIKENHIAAAGSIDNAVKAVRARSPGVAVEVEVESLEEMSRAIAAKADLLLLDNFSPEQLQIGRAHV